MKNIIIGFVLSFFTSGLSFAAACGIRRLFAGHIFALLPAAVCLVVSALFAWLIGDMCDG